MKTIESQSAAIVSPGEMEWWSRPPKTKYIDVPANFRVWPKHIVTACCLLSGSWKPRHVIAHFVCVEIYSQSSSGSNFIHNQNSLSLPALLTRRLGPSPPPCQPCEALIFPPCVALCLLHLHHLHHSETDFPAFPEFTSRRLPSSTGSQVSTSQSAWTTINQLKFGAVRRVVAVPGTWARSARSGAPSLRMLRGAKPTSEGRQQQQPGRAHLRGAASTSLRCCCCCCWRLWSCFLPPLRHRLLLAGRLEIEVVEKEKCDVGN